MPETTELDAVKLGEQINLGMLDLVYHLGEAGVHHDMYIRPLDAINAAVAELLLRVDQGWPKELHAQYLAVLDERDEHQTRVSQLEGGLMAVRQELRSLVNGLDNVLDDRGGEENDSQ